VRIVTLTGTSTQVEWLPVLANEAPSDLRRRKSAKRILDIIKHNPSLPLFKDITNEAKIKVSRLKHNTHGWISTGYTEKPMERLVRPELLPGWKPRTKASRSWPPVSTMDNPLSRIRTEQDRCGCTLFKWGMTQTPLCECGLEQAIRHVQMPRDKIWRKHRATP